MQTRGARERHERRFGGRILARRAGGFAVRGRGLGGASHDLRIDLDARVHGEDVGQAVVVDIGHVHRHNGDVRRTLVHVAGLWRLVGRGSDEARRAAIGVDPQAVIVAEQQIRETVGVHVGGGDHPGTFGREPRQMADVGEPAVDALHEDTQSTGDVDAQEVGSPVAVDVGARDVAHRRQGVQPGNCGARLEASTGVAPHAQPGSTGNGDDEIRIAVRLQVDGARGVDRIFDAEQALGRRPAAAHEPDV